jgi:Kdo2-lipid IVA lauroyltransferase/acyltransferase
LKEAKRKVESSQRLAVELGLMRLLSRTMERASWDGCRRAGALLGLVFFHGVHSRRDLAIGNVRLAFPDLGEAAARRIARCSVQNFGMTICEFLHLNAASRSEVRDYVNIEGLEHFQAGLERGHGVLLITAHLGNWELMGARLAQELPLTVVARPTSNSGVEEHILSVRSHSGMRVLSKHAASRAVLNVLRANEVVGILPDQYARKEGVVMPMFGHPTRFVPGVSRLAMLADSLLVPSFGVRRTPWLADGRIVATAQPGFALRRSESRDPASREAAALEGTRHIVAEVESAVRRNPEQWMWVHRRWRTRDTEHAPKLQK